VRAVSIPCDQKGAIESCCRYDRLSRVAVATIGYSSEGYGRIGFVGNVDKSTTPVGLGQRRRITVTVVSTERVVTVVVPTAKEAPSSSRFIGESTAAIGLMLFRRKQ